MIYLASPYMHPSEAVKQARYEAVILNAIAVTKLTGEAVFSPIAHSHLMHVWSNGEIGGDWKQWSEFDRAVIAAASRYMILTLEGWEESVGIAAESMIAQELGRVIDYWTPNPDVKLQDFAA